MDSFDIYDAEHRFKDCADRRPWLIIEHRDNFQIACFPISGERYGDFGFYLDPHHPDFAVTGLSKACYILDERLYEVPLMGFRKFRGRLANVLLAEFRRYAGV